jgi:hypothetical protein
MKHQKPNQLHLQHPDRKILALHPLLQKGGVHDAEDIGQARRRDRRQTRQRLRQQGWRGED